MWWRTEDVVGVTFILVRRIREINHEKEANRKECGIMFKAEYVPSEAWCGQKTKTSLKLRHREQGKWKELRTEK